MANDIIRSDKIFKIIVYYSDAPAQMDELDAIWFENKLWIVPAWYEYQHGEFRTPTRIIGLAALQYVRAENSQAVDFSLNGLLPKAVVEGLDPSPAKYGYVVIEDPDFLR